MQPFRAVARPLCLRPLRAPAMHRTYTSQGIIQGGQCSIYSLFHNHIFLFIQQSGRPQGTGTAVSLPSSAALTPLPLNLLESKKLTHATEGDVVSIRRTRGGRSVHLSPPLRPDWEFSVEGCSLKGSDLIGRPYHDVISADKGRKAFRLSETSLSSYVVYAPRLVTPVSDDDP